MSTFAEPRLERPVDLNDALRMRSAAPGSTLLAGGTDLMVEVGAGRFHPSHMIALRRIEELRRWDGDTIGSGVSWSRLQNARDPALREIAVSIGSRQIRNVATIGGNVATASPAGDGLAFLAAVDASVEVAAYGQPRRRVPLAEFLLGPKRTALGAEEIITAIVLPAHRGRLQAFAKVGRRGAMVISLVSACVTRDELGDLHIALGAVAPTVVRAREAERLVNSERRRSAALQMEVMRLLRDAVSPITDHRGTREYRVHASAVLAWRLIEKLCAA